MTKFLFFLSLLSLISSGFSQAFMQVPIEGEQGKDWIIVNYVDWSFEGVKDHHCGTKAYDGHQGTDYVLRSFEQMHGNVAILAAADGKVVYTKDGEFDEETEGIISKEFGNYIAIKHPNSYFTYYAHLKKNSLLVAIGDSVKAGDPIAYVGSSGNSTDPHLHFEVWYDSLYLVDPFAGSCGNPESLFLMPTPYDTSLIVWDSGLILKNGMGLNDIRFQNGVIDCCPSTVAPTPDSTLNCWAHLSGVREGTVLRLEWIDPYGATVETFTHQVARDYWYYFFWGNLPQTNLAMGQWHTNLFYNDSLLLTHPFMVRENTTAYYQNIQPDNDNGIITTEHVRLIDMAGKIHNYPVHTDLPAGIYLFEINQPTGADQNQYIVKKWLE